MKKNKFKDQERNYLVALFLQINEILNKAS